MKTLFGLLGKEKNDSAISSTYNIGLLQTKAYKAIMGKTAELLEKSKLSNIDWVALGIIYDHPIGLRSLALAEILSVEQPFVTVLTNKLAKRGLVVVSSDPTDKRAKIIHASKAGKVFVKQTEGMLIKEMEKVSAGISREDALVYFKVLKSIVDYSEKHQ